MRQRKRDADLFPCNRSASLFRATTTSNSGGLDTFSGVVAGDYYLQVIAPSAYVFSPEHQGTDPTIDSDVDAYGFTSVFTLGLNQNLDHLDAGLYAGSKVG